MPYRYIIPGNHVVFPPLVPVPRRCGLDLFLQLRCWWLDNSACSVDAIRDLFPKTLSEYKRARVAPFG